MEEAEDAPEDGMLRLVEVEEAAEADLSLDLNRLLMFRPPLLLASPDPELGLILGQRSTFSRAEYIEDRADSQST